MDDLTLARAIHVTAIAHWIGGVSFVTLVLLPGVRKLVAPEERALLFEPLFLHRGFAEQARRSSAETMKRVWRGHLILLALSLVAVIASVLGAHGALY